MKRLIHYTIVAITLILIFSCNRNTESTINIAFLHHSTGNLIWWGSNEISLLTRAVRKINRDLGDAVGSKPELKLLLNEYNRQNDKNYLIEEFAFPKESPYGWKNYPYDYYNIWVKNQGNDPYMDEPTLEILTKKYQVIIFKHCFPVCSIEEPTDSADVNSEIKTLPNYKLQYLALRDKLNDFPETKFILFTGAARVQESISEGEALRAAEFFIWVKEDWDLEGDNIYLWDLYDLQTEGSLYFKDEYAVSPSNSHPNKFFAGKVVKLLVNRLTDIIENDGAKTNLKGEPTD
ncbi:MAG: hypothetical protein GT600_07275 [Bacteroidales bacterium]|nr:hypothetical protein [Bacteroidales bacterium]HPM03237.1 hypothetical protein [Candidatus Cloacimonadota bacterium]